MASMREMCACGQPLHYSNPHLRAIVEATIEGYGECIKIASNGQAWLVPRHYIALHGLRAVDLGTANVPAFEEVNA